MRLGMNHRLLGVLLAELFVFQKGIGYYVNLLTSSFKMDALFAIILILAAVAISVNQLLLRLEKHLSSWRES
jgi:NitT/TauT family transport system permease protein